MDNTFSGGAAYLENPEILLSFFSKSSERPLQKPDRQEGPGLSRCRSPTVRKGPVSGYSMALP